MADERKIVPKVSEILTSIQGGKLLLTTKERPKARNTQTGTAIEW
jgi:hypothetical protein